MIYPQRALSSLWTFFLHQSFKRRYISKKLKIGELLKVQDHRICRKVSSIPNHPHIANFPKTKTRYNQRNKSAAIPAIYTDRFKNTFFHRVVFKYNVALKVVYFLHLIFAFISINVWILLRGILIVNGPLLLLSYCNIINSKRTDCKW